MDPRPPGQIAWDDSRKRRMNRRRCWAWLGHAAGWLLLFLGFALGCVVACVEDFAVGLFLFTVFS